MSIMASDLAPGTSLPDSLPGVRRSSLSKPHWSLATLPALLSVGYRLREWFRHALRAAKPALVEIVETKLCQVGVRCISERITGTFKAECVIFDGPFSDLDQLRYVNTS
jgi:hypothetical protein